MSLLDSIARGLALPTQFVMSISRRADYSYKVYQIPKKRGGVRTIAHPAKPLKALQRWLLANVIAQWRVHDSAVAYRPSVGILDNARRHQASRYLLRLDIQDFFESIRNEDVSTFLAEGRPPGTTDWDVPDRALFLALACRRGRLTIGAPTSPGLSNAICFDLDGRLSDIARERGLVYTRYADDLFFSATDRDLLADLDARTEGVLGALPFPAGMRLNRSKTFHSSRKGRRLVTGLVLTSDGGVSVGRARKRFLRREIHRLALLNQEERSRLAGTLAFVQSIEPDLINALVLKYGPEAVEQARRGRDA